MAQDRAAGCHRKGWRKLAKNVRRWAVRLLLMPVPNWPARRERDPADGAEERAAPVLYEALSDDGPFRRMSAEEAHRHVVFACCYYLCLAVGILILIISH